MPICAIACQDTPALTAQASSTNARRSLAPTKVFAQISLLDTDAPVQTDGRVTIAARNGPAAYHFRARTAPYVRMPTGHTRARVRLDTPVSSAPSILTSVLRSRAPTLALALTSAPTLPASVPRAGPVSSAPLLLMSALHNHVPTRPPALTA